MINGLIVTKAPSCSMAPAAFAELAIAVELFEYGARTSSRARTGMVCILSRTDLDIKLKVTF